MLKYLNESVDGKSVAFIRIAFAAVMIYWLAEHIVYDKISYNYYQPSYLFPYFGWDWFGRWPGRGLHWHFVITLLAAAGMLVGAFYRFSSVVFAACFVYIFLLDKTTYQNHYYFVSLMAVLLAVCPVHRCWSYGGLRLGLPQTVPRWVVWLLRFQIGIVYFYGGVAKMNIDWLSGFPMQHVLAGKQDHFLIGSFCQEVWFVHVFCWAGMLFDLLIAPMLLFPKTRRLGYLLALAFHLTNATLFKIGIFPWLMIFVTTIFFAPDWPDRVLVFFKQKESTPPEVKPAKVASPQRASGWRRVLLYSFLCVFVLLQVLLPLRHFAWAENTSWTERNHHFSWHMKLRGKRTLFRYYVIDKASGRGRYFSMKGHLKLHQLKRLSVDPYMIRDFARFIKSYHEFKGMHDGSVIQDVAVRAFVMCSLNGRTPQLMIDPNVDLAADELPDNWIVPLKEDIGGGWYAPVESWEQLGMEDPILKGFMAGQE